VTTMPRFNRYSTLTSDASLRCDPHAPGTPVADRSPGCDCPVDDLGAFIGEGGERVTASMSTSTSHDLASRTSTFRFRWSCLARAIMREASPAGDVQVECVARIDADEFDAANSNTGAPRQGTVELRVLASGVVRPAGRHAPEGASVQTSSLPLTSQPVGALRPELADLFERPLAIRAKITLHGRWLVAELRGTEHAGPESHVAGLVIHAIVDVAHALRGFDEAEPRSEYEPELVREPEPEPEPEPELGLDAHGGEARRGAGTAPIGARIGGQIEGQIGGRIGAPVDYVATTLFQVLGIAGGRYGPPSGKWSTGA
jgi:hypothetical protein